MFNALSLNKRLAIILGGIVLVIVGLSYLTLSLISPKKPSRITPFPTPTRFQTDRKRVTQISPLQKTAIGELANNLETMVSFQEKKILPDGSVQYSFSGIVSSRPNIVIAKNNIITFEKIVTPEKSTEKGYARVSEFLRLYGQAERVIRGSLFYGDFASTYIYASKGFSFIGNQHTDEIFEIHLYSPTTPDTYVRQYGQDINPRQEPISEGQ